MRTSSDDLFAIFTGLSREDLVEMGISSSSLQHRSIWTILDKVVRQPCLFHWFSFPFSPSNYSLICLCCISRLSRRHHGTGLVFFMLFYGFCLLLPVFIQCKMWSQTKRWGMTLSGIWALEQMMHVSSIIELWTWAEEWLQWSWWRNSSGGVCGWVGCNRSGGESR